MKRAAYRILIVDDHPILCLGMTQLLESDQRFHVCATANSAEEALKQAEKHQPDLAILDITLNGETRGLTLARELRQLYPKLGLLMLSIHPEQKYAAQALKMGANGYIMKEEATSRLLDSVQAVLSGQLCFSPQVTQQMLVQLVQGAEAGRDADLPEMPELEQLSERELEVFKLLGKGLQVREIAEQLELAPKTIHAHRLNIMHKLKVKNAGRLNHLAFEYTQRKLSL